MLFKSLYEIWDQFGWEWDDLRALKPTNAELKSAEKMARARADANGGFWINGVYVRIAAEITAAAAAS